MAYTFSIRVKRNVTRLVPRPWWAIFGRDALKSEMVWETVAFYQLSDPEAEVIKRMSHSGWTTPEAILFLRAFGSPLFCDIRLVQEPTVKPVYYKTTAMVNQLKVES